MPLYEYICVCGHITSDLRPMRERNNIAICEKCGFVAERKMSTPNIVTDTNFGYTGKIDPRLGGHKIEGRKDFWQRVKNKGLKEVDLKELTNNPQTLEKRLKKVAI